VDLYLIRHAIAEPRDSARWPDDSARPLSEDGITLFRTAARGLRRLGVNPDALVTSPYVRAWQTAEILAQEAGWPRPSESHALEPPRSPAAAVELIQSRDVQSVALVGHQPHLSELASLLLTRNLDVELELKKGGLIWLRFAGRPTPGSALLRVSLSPKILRQLGR
jgi:phosphohistidine phosphatase